MKQNDNCKKHDWGTLLILIVTIEGLAIIANMFNKGSGKYYELLRKPFFALPSIILAIIWPFVLIFISIAAYLFIRKSIIKGVNTNKGMLYYSVQVLLNFMWPFIFFRLNLYGISFLLSLLLIMTIVLTTKEFFKRCKLSGYFMLPYIILIIYMSIVNYYIWLLNEA